MDDKLLFYGKISISDISDNMKSFELTEAALFLYMLLQIPILTELSHDINIIFGHEYLDGPQDVGVIECSEGVDFVIEKILFDFTLNFGELKHFNGNRFLGEFVDPFENLRAKAASYDFLRVINIIFDLLHHLLLFIPNNALTDHLLSKQSNIIKHATTNK